MKQNSSILFLVNPFAGKGNALNTAQNSIAVMHQNGLDTALLVSKTTGDLASFVHKYNASNISKIAVLGGDGTMHEVINAMMQEPDWLAVPIMLFPCGTGNAFNYDLDCLTSKKDTQLLLT